eukprot:13475421-Alexandrium_andersonii.AAC.1
MQIRFRQSNLELRGPRNGLEIGPRSSRWGAFCAASRTDPESARESGPRGGPRARNREVAHSHLQSANPQSAQRLAIG